MKNTIKAAISEKKSTKLKVGTDVPTSRQNSPLNSNFTQKKIIMHTVLQSLLRNIATNLMDKHSFLKLQFRNSNSYFGRLTSNGFNGFGTYIFRTGACFKGTFEGSLSKGLGSLTYSNLDVYEGEFLAGLPHGYGHYKSKRLRYSGYFQNGKFHGNGILKTETHEIEGVFYMGKIQSGDCRVQSGVYNGTFNCSAISQNENGKFTFKNGNFYIGSWAGDQFMGFGEYNWTAEEGTSTKMETKYTGYWWNGKKHGLGMLTFNSRCVICQWSYGKKSGAGIIIACNGSCYCSEELFIGNQYKDSHCIRNCQGSREILLEALNILTLNSKHASMKEKINSFVNIVKKLLKEYSICTSPIDPIHIPDYEIQKESPTPSLEFRHLQQVLVENYATFKNLYTKYTQSTDGFLNGFGLNLFYIDVFHKVRDINILECLKAGQFSIQKSHFYSVRKHRKNLLAFISFYEFFQHFVHITEILMENEELKTKINELRPTFFGHLAIRVLLVVKMMETNSATSLLLVREGIRTNLPKLVKLLDLLDEMFPNGNNIRTAYKFLKVKEIVKGRSLEFLDTVNKFYSINIESFDLFDDHYELSKLELIEIILRTCQYKLRNNLQ